MYSYYLNDAIIDSLKGRCKLKEKAIAEYKAALLLPRKKRKKLKNQHYYYITLLVGILLINP